MSHQEYPKIIVESDFCEEDAVTLDNMLDEYILKQTSGRHSDLAISLRKSDGQIVGGLIGDIAWGILYIQSLTVHSDYRGQGYGAQLLAAAEKEGIAKDCHLVYLDTMSFEAPVFYQKQGYTIFHVLQGWPEKYKRYLLEKKLR
jgi:ribosomal protein S18 acetylase RimI-like enzyme